MFFIVELLVTILSYIVFTTNYQLELSFISGLIFGIVLLISTIKIKRITLYTLLFSFLLAICILNIFILNIFITEFLVITTLFFFRDILVALNIERLEHERNK